MWGFVGMAPLFPGSFSLGLTLPFARLSNSALPLPVIPAQAPPFDGQSPKPVRPLARNPAQGRAVLVACRSLPAPPRPFGGFRWLKRHRASLSRQASFGSCRRDGPFSQIQELHMQNIVILAGNIGQSPEVRTTQGGTKITNFTLACPKAGSSAMRTATA
jgi:Single-strand binding protein family